MSISTAHRGEHRNGSTNRLDLSCWFIHYGFLTFHCDKQQGRVFTALLSVAVLNAEAVQGGSHFAGMEQYLGVFFNFYFNKPRIIARKLLDVSSQENSYISFIQLDDGELLLFLLAAATSDKVQGLGAKVMITSPIPQLAMPSVLPVWG